MKFVFIAKHRSIWPVAWLCEALGVSRSGFHAWLTRSPSRRAREDEEIGAKVRASFIASSRTYGARRVWRDVLAEGVSCGLHRIERLMRAQALRARPRRRGLPKDEGERLAATVAPNVLDRQFVAERPNQKWIADSRLPHARAGAKVLRPVQAEQTSGYVGETAARAAPGRRRCGYCPIQGAHRARSRMRHRQAVESPVEDAAIGKGDRAGQLRVGIGRRAREIVRSSRPPPCPDSMLLRGWARPL